MMTLIAVAISVAYFYSVTVTFGLPGVSFFWELVTLIDVTLLGQWLETRSVIGASRAGRAGAAAAGHCLKLDAQGNAQEVPASALQPGDRVLIRPGAKVPVDGAITEGESFFNEATLTGESRPVSKKPGDVVIGGALNGAGAVTIKVKATGDKTYLSRVIEMVKQAQASRSGTQDVANRAMKLSRNSMRPTTRPASRRKESKQKAAATPVPPPFPPRAGERRLQGAGAHGACALRRNSAVW
jgi:Cu2+-exporting ATPase